MLRCAIVHHVWALILFQFLCVLAVLLFQLTPSKISGHFAKNEVKLPGAANRVANLESDTKNVAMTTTNLTETPHRTGIPLKPEYVTWAGESRNTTGYLTIGIPVTLRPEVGLEYFKMSMSSVMEALTSYPCGNITVVVFVAASGGHDLFSDVTKYLRGEYPEQVACGVLRVVTVAQKAYPLLHNPRSKNIKDNLDRVHWRMKQALDYAFMIHLAQNLSRYYLQLEDDVICSRDFIRRISEFVDIQTRRWTLLEFTDQGFIGKLFPSDVLRDFARYIWMFYREVPVDWLMLRFRSLVKHRRFYKGRVLFRHIGHFSSLKGQRRKDAFKIEKVPMHEH